MNKNLYILGDILNFLLVGILFITVLAVVFAITIKDYKKNNSKMKFYKLFIGMDNRSILAFGLITLNYIFLVWATATFFGLNIYYIFITVVFMLLSDIVMKKYHRIPIDLIYSMINMSFIFITSLLYDYLITKYTTIYLLILLGILILFVFLYYTYITFKLLNNIVIGEEEIKKRKKKI